MTVDVSRVDSPTLEYERQMVLFLLRRLQTDI